MSAQGTAILPLPVEAPVSARIAYQRSIGAPGFECAVVRPLVLLAGDLEVVRRLVG